MKNVFLFLLLALVSLTLSFKIPAVKELSQLKAKPTPPEWQEGDLIFQSSTGGQGMAIQLATHSPYTHVGMMIKRNQQWMVLEAIQPVCITPLQEFIDRGDNKFYSVKRLKDGAFPQTACVLEHQKKHVGKPYDAYFGWGDDRLYCSELVWKIYKQCCNKEVGKLEKMKDLDLSNPIVQYKLKERYGKNIPYEEKVITPASMFNSDLLKEVYTQGKL